MNSKQSMLAPQTAKIQSTISGINFTKNNNQDHAKRMAVNVFWDDFVTLNLDANFLSFDCAPDDE